MNEQLFWYKNKQYPDYIRHGNAQQYILPVAQFFCQGKGIDVGCGKWPFPGALAVDIKEGVDACDLPGEEYDYVFSSHCLEHLIDPVAALRHWREKLSAGGVLFLYLPHPDMEYWRPQNCSKHLHSWYPRQIRSLLIDLGFEDVLYGERDLAWSFAAIGFKPKERA